MDTTYGIVILLGIIAGIINRWLLLRIDYRQYPSSPHGAFTHMAIGVIAASLGAVAVPAIAKPDYVAVTFLVLAAGEFRNVRTVERETLSNLEENKLVSRGTDYIEGIARVFEARNYLVILTSLVTSGAAQLWGWKWAVLVAGISLITTMSIRHGSFIGEIADISKGKVHFEGSLLMVDDVVIMNVGLPMTREKIQAEGIGVIIKPKDDNARITLHSPGQRKAIIHDVVSILGTKVDINETELIPMARKQVDEGYLALFLVANEPDIEMVIEIVKRVPVLETSRGAVLKTYTGRKAAD